MLLKVNYIFRHPHVCTPELNSVCWFHIQIEFKLFVAKLNQPNKYPPWMFFLVCHSNDKSFPPVNVNTESPFPILDRKPAAKLSRKFSPPLFFSHKWFKSKRSWILWIKNDTYDWYGMEWLFRFNYNLKEMNNNFKWFRMFGAPKWLLIWPNVILLKSCINFYVNNIY